MAFSPIVGDIIRLSATEGVLDPASHPAERLARTVSEAPPEVLEVVPQAAWFHGTAAYTYEAVRNLGLPVKAVNDLRYLRDRTAMLHLRTRTDLAYLDSALGDADIPWMVFKGPTLAEPVHGSAQHRSYGDLDVLVRGSDLRQALSVLESTGSRLTDRNWTLIDDHFKGEVHLALPSGSQLDLHWHLFNEPTRRELFPVSIDELFARSREVRVSGRAVRTLSLADTVVYVSMHTLHSGGDRLIWLKDIERLLALPEVEPTEVASRARAWRAEIVLVSGLRRTELTFGPVAHADTLRQSCGEHRAWVALASWAWRRSPAELEDGHGSLGRVVCRSARRTQTESFRELIRRGILHLRHRREGSEDGPRWFPTNDPRSARYESGGEARREAFLQRVSKQQS